MHFRLAADGVLKIAYKKEASYLLEINLLLLGEQK